MSLAPIWLRAWLDWEKTRLAAAWIRPDFVREQHIARRRHRLVESWRDSLPGPDAPDSGYLTLAATTAGYLPRFTFPKQSALPYYDRDLVQFLFSIPGEQLLRPQQRRSLMRRGLGESSPTSFSAVRPKRSDAALQPCSPWTTPQPSTPSSPNPTV